MPLRVFPSIEQHFFSKSATVKSLQVIIEAVCQKDMGLMTSYDNLISSC